METTKFKTTIKCSGCVATVTPHLNKAIGENNWKVDLENPAKILTVTSEKEINEETVVKALADAGYKAEKLN